MKNPNIKEALRIVPTISGKLFSKPELLLAGFKLGQEEYWLKYNPQEELKTQVLTNGDQTFSFDASLAIYQRNRNLPTINIEDVLLESDELAKRQLLIFSQLRPEKQVTIASTIVTRPEYRGQGLGSILFALHEQMISDLLKRHSDTFQNYPVIAEIRDITSSNWSSYWAQRLGFINLPPWQKRYQ